jgi:hypothetical protein
MLVIYYTNSAYISQVKNAYLAKIVREKHFTAYRVLRIVYHDLLF